MHFVLSQGMAQRVFTQQDEPGQHFVFDRLHPAFRVGIQIGRSGRQHHTLHADTRYSLRRRSS
jgi:hypothetical protein